jgi:hypothetical protein
LCIARSCFLIELSEHVHRIRRFRCHHPAALRATDGVGARLGLQDLREVRVLGRISAGVIKLFEDPPARGPIAVTFFDSAVMRASDSPSALFRELDALVRTISAKSAR